MRFVRHLRNGESELCVRLGQELVALCDIDAQLPGSLERLLALGASALDAIGRGAGAARRRTPVQGATYLPPLTHPGKVICVGLNYADHAAEAQLKSPDYPAFFARFTQSFVGHGAALVRPRISDKFDYEGELVAVVGRRARAVSRARALECVAGYTVFNDGSIRDYQFKSTQWLVGKNFDRTGACGPELVTADELPPGASGLKLQTRLNGELLQNANTRDMLFDVASLVALCSEVLQLEPGDMIVTGTPAGVGFARKPPLFMAPGDVCEIAIEQLGTLVNPVVAESPG